MVDTPSATYLEKKYFTTASVVAVGFFFFAISLMIPFSGGKAWAVVLYDGSQNTLPSVQGWIFGFYPLTGISATQTAAGGTTRLDTTPEIDDSAGYFTKSTLPLPPHPNNPVLDQSKGFTVNFNLQVISENHINSNRAGFSVIVITNDGISGIELGFWENEIWAQADNPLFTKAESIFFDTTATFTDYSLSIHKETYILFANGDPILTGQLRDYTAFPDSVLDVYELSDLLFFGDDTSSADADVQLQSIEVRGHLPGDIDGSQLVDLGDAIIAFKILSGMNPEGLFSPAALFGSDVDGDNVIGLPDAVYVLQKLVSIR